jgi:hypothetical protein
MSARMSARWCSLYSIYQYLGLIDARCSLYSIYQYLGLIGARCSIYSTNTVVLFHGRYNRLIIDWFTCFHMFSLVFTCFHLFPLVFTCVHFGSLVVFTCFPSLVVFTCCLHLLSSPGLFYLFQPTNIWRTKNLGKWKTNPNGNAPSSEQSWRPVITLPMCECHPWPILLSFLPWLSDFLSILTGFLQCYSVLSSNVGKITLFKRQRDSPFSTFPLKIKIKI